MAGKQIYTSSLFVQSGSVAKFESGLEVTESIRVDGTVSASGYFDLEGNEITGGVVKEFFAGTSAGVSSSNPRSEDIFVELQSGELQTSNIIIHTTHSNTFDPNHYAFVKIEDEFITQVEGSDSNYDVGALSPGVHRYLVYGAQTGSGGETHQVYTTLFVKGFFNEAPNLDLPTSPTLSIAHDETVGSLILHFTESFDENQNDAISFFTASRETALPTDATSTNAYYVLAMYHSNFSGQSYNNQYLLKTSSLNTDTHNGLKPYKDTLYFTASISSYDIVDNNNDVYYQNRNDEVEFKITLKDENEVVNSGISGVTTENFKLHILAPPTASIENIRTEFEDGGFTGIPTSNLTHTLLYDRTESLSSASIVELHDRYTSSLIRLSTKADITPPAGYNPPSEYNTFIRVQSGSNDEFLDFNDKSGKLISIFKFKSGESTASSYGNNFNTATNNTESLGFTSFVFKPTFLDNEEVPPNTASLYVGINNRPNNTDSIQHGINNHYEASPLDLSELTIRNIPNIEISNVVVEVESGSYGSNIGYPNLTSSLLAGYTSSLLSSQTQSLLIDKLTNGINHPQSSNYIASSIVRLRVKAQITEPFGPDHKPITFTLTGSNSNNTLQFSHPFIFSTSSGISNCIDSSSVYSNETKQRLVGTYTSSWVDFNFKEGVYNFTTQLASSSNASSTIDTISTAVVSMSNYNNVLLNDLVYETEEYGHSGESNLTTTTNRQVLYGHNHILYGDSSSYADHPSSSVYVSQSLRMRVRGKITEPFGPVTSKLDFDFKSINNSDDTTDLNVISNAFSVNTLNSNEYNSNNQLVTTFTSSLIGKTLQLIGATSGASQTSNWELNGDRTFTSNIENEFQANTTIEVQSPIITSQVTVTDTPATEFQFTPIETETFGESNVALINPVEANYSEVSRSIRFSNEVSTISTLVIEDRYSVLFTEDPLWAYTDLTSPFITTIIGTNESSNSGLYYVNDNILSEGDIIELKWSDASTYVHSSNNNTIYTETLKVKNTFTEGSGYSTMTSENFKNYVISFDTTSHPLSSEFQAVTTQDGNTSGHAGFTIENLSKIETQGTVGEYLRFTDPTGSGITNSLTGSSVTRFRTLVTVTEPLGPLHHATKIRTKFNKKNSTSNPIYGPRLTFSTNSLDIFDSSSTYDNQTRLVISYTSSFTGSALTSTPNNQYWETYVSPGSVNHNVDLDHNPSGENGHDYSEIDNDSKLFFVVTGSDNTVKIEDIFVEVESASLGNLTGFGSNEGHHELTSSLMYGLTSSLLSTQTQSFISTQVPLETPAELINKYNSGSIIRFRLKSKITEPYGNDEPLTISASFEGLQASKEEVEIKHSFTVGSASNGSDNNHPVDLQIPELGGVGPYRKFDIPLDLTSQLGGNESSLTNINIKGIRLRGDLGGDGGDSEYLQNFTLGSNNIGTIQATDDNTSNFTDALFFPTRNSLSYPYSVPINNGIVDLAFSSSAQVYHKTFGTISDMAPNSWEVQIDFEYVTSEIKDTFLSKLYSPTFSFGLLSDQPTDSNVMSSVLSSSNSNFSSEDGLTRVVNSFTSSWVEFQIPTGSFDFVPLYSVDPSLGFEISTSLNPHTTASVTMSKTLPTQLVDLAYETEKHGYAGSGSNDANIVTDTTRTVLYGDAHVTNATSESKVWENHENEIFYASASVSRFRVKGKIIEPFGPASCVPNIHWIKSSSENPSNYFEYTTPLEINTKNPSSTWIVNQSYNGNDRRITSFTQSAFTNDIDLTLDSSNYGGTENFIISGNVSYQIVDVDAPFPGTNELTIETPTTTSIDVVDTADPFIQINGIFTELVGESNQGNNNIDEANPAFISKFIYNGFKTLATGSGIPDQFTGSAVTRFLFTGKRIDPLGYTHDPLTLQLTHEGKANHAGTNINNPAIIIATNSLDLNLDPNVNTYGYDSQYRLTSSFNTKFIGSELPTSLGISNEHGYYKTSFSNTSLHDNGLIDYTFSPTSNQLFHVVSKSLSDIDKITVTNLKVEVELTESGSNSWGNERITNVLHGLTGTETNQTTNATYNDDSKDQLVMVRLRATIEEPPQTIHNELPFTVGGFSGTKVITFATNSSDVHTASIPAGSQGIKRNYISHPFPILLNAAGNTNTSTENAERIKYEISASVGTPSIQNSVTPDNIILSDLSHSIIHVTGAFSSSTAITIGTNLGFNNNISYSSGIGHYYVYNSNMGSYDALYISPLPNGLNTTEPPLTSINNLVYPTHLSINYTPSDSLPYYTPPFTNGDAYGHAKFLIYKSQISQFDDIESVTVTTKVTNNEEGNGFNSKSTTIKLIPPPPANMLSNFAEQIFDAHPNGRKNLFYQGLLPADSFDHYSGSESDYPQNPMVNGSVFVSSSRIINTQPATSQQLGNYKIKLYTHPNNTANYTGNSNKPFNFGDLGTLELKLNGTSVVNYDLATPFNTSNKTTFQNLSSYPGGGTSSFTGGRLILTQVGNFNSMDQSITFGGRTFTNGYQGWAASIELDDKIRDGYNYLQLIHNISSTYTQSMDVFDWYYDDGFPDTQANLPYKKPKIDTTNPVITWSKNPNVASSPTMSLSGVSYFLEDVAFNTSFNNNILNVAYDTYQMKIARTTPGSNLLVDGIDTPTDHGAVYLNHLQYNDVSETDFAIPTINSTASIVDIPTMGRNVSFATDELGEVREITYNVFERDKSKQNSSIVGDSITLPVGRFMDNGNFIDSTENTENFYKENYRWRESVIDNQGYANDSGTSILHTSPTDLGYNDYSMWMDNQNTNTPWNSAESLVTQTNELQQTVLGYLRHPQSPGTDYRSYSGVTGNVLNPNSPNYSALINSSRTYYRCFYLRDASPSDNFFNIEVTGSHVTSGGSDFSGRLFSNSTNFETFFSSVRCQIHIKIPGPETNNATNSDSQPGTHWGLVNSRFAGFSSVREDHWAALYSFSFSTTSDGFEAFRTRVNLKGCTLRHKYVFVRVRMVDNTNNIFIKTIKVLPDV